MDMRNDPTAAGASLWWNLALLVAGALGLVVLVGACWFGFALLAIWLGLPGE